MLFLGNPGFWVALRVAADRRFHHNGLLARNGYGGYLFGFALQDRFIHNVIISY